MTARPTPISTALRLPSAPPTQRPTRMPASTPLIALRSALAPSPYPIRPSVSPLANISALTSTLQFRNANATALRDPVKLQQTTANIACALRVPLENIVIKNITQQLPDGAIVTIPFDPRIATLNSAGTVACPVGTVRRLLRRTLQQSQTSVSIDFIIVDPTPAILTMDPTIFATVVEDDAAMSSLSAILGSTGISALPPPELALAVASAPSDAPASGSGSSPSNSPISVTHIIAGVLSAFAAGGLIVGAVLIAFSRRQSPLVAATAVATTKRPTVVVYSQDALTENPLVSVAINQQSASRQHFDPVGARV